MTDRRLGARYLTWLLAIGTKDLVPASEIVLSGALIDGPIDFSGLNIPLAPRFRNCTFSDAIILNDAKCPLIEFSKCALPELVADRLETGGVFQLSDCKLAHRVRICGAKIGGNLDLRGTHIQTDRSIDTSSVAFFADGLDVSGNAFFSKGFKAGGEVRLNGSTFHRNLDFSGASLNTWSQFCLSALNANVHGSVHLCRNQPWANDPNDRAFQAVGTVQFEGARIDGDFDCRGGHFRAPRYSDQNLSDRIDPDEAARAISAKNLAVGGSIVLSDDFHSIGSVRLINARIGSDVLCDGGFFDHACDDAIEADGIIVDGTVFFDECDGTPLFAKVPLARTNGFLKFDCAELKQGFLISKAIFEPDPVRMPPPEDGVAGNCGLLVRFAKIGSALTFVEIARHGPPARTPGAGICVNLRQTKSDVLEDDEESWRLVIAPNLAGFEYSAIERPEGSEGWRLDVLGRQHGASALRANVQNTNSPPSLPGRLGRKRSLAANFETAETAPLPPITSEEFEPQPYLWLAKIMNEAGYEPAATRVLVQLERMRTRYGHYGILGFLGRHIQSITIDYGYRPIKALYSLAVLTALSWVVFSAASNAQIEDTMPLAERPVAVASAEKAPSSLLWGNPDFSPGYYAFDTLVPAIDLGEKSRWHAKLPFMIDEPAAMAYGPLFILRHFLVPYVALLNRILAWALAGLFLAGVTGWLRKDVNAGS